jgi:hypothetical protein
MAEIGLVVVDLDGTLLDDRKAVAPADAAALECLLEDGVAVALATARDPASIYQKLPWRRIGLYYLGSGGALVYDTATDRTLWASYLAPASLVEAVTFLRCYGHPVFLNDFDDYWVDRENARVQMIRERYNLATRPFGDPARVDRPIMRASLAAPVAVLEQAAAEAKARWGGRLCVSLASPDWLDLMAPDGGKGAALQILQRHLQLGPDRTLAIGDYDSDLALFEQARYRVAMANGVPAVRAAATYLTASNNEQGVARAIAAHCRLGDAGSPAAEIEGR